MNTSQQIPTSFFLFINWTTLSDFQTVNYMIAIGENKHFNHFVTDLLNLLFVPLKYDTLIQINNILASNNQ